MNSQQRQRDQNGRTPTIPRRAGSSGWAVPAVPRRLRFDWRRKALPSTAPSVTTAGQIAGGTSNTDTPLAPAEKSLSGIGCNKCSQVW
jgi:hypothetical protein